MSPAARNRFFGTMYFWYGLPPMSFLARSQFFPSPGTSQQLFGFVLAFLGAMMFIRWGFSRGGWFGDLKR
jgi:hypothetical protein